MKGSLLVNFVAAIGLSHSVLAGGHRGQHMARTHSKSLLSRRDNGTDTDISKRQGQTFGPAEMTYYITGLGACGQYNSPGDFIVALNSAQYGGGYPGPQCFKQIIIDFEGKQTTATIVDECPTCDYGELDLSEGLFTQYRPTGDGHFYGRWWFAGEGPAPPPPPPVTTTTSEAPPPPPPTTSSTSTLVQIDIPSTTSSASGSSTDTSGVPEESQGSPDTVQYGSIGQAYQAVVQLSQIVAHAADVDFN